MNKKLIYYFTTIFFTLSLHAAQKETQIKSGTIWTDSNGKMINAHGAGILYHEGTYYMYGEYKGDSTYWNPKVPKWECYRTAACGISCYSSKDLLNWKFEGVVLPPNTQDTLSDLHPSKVLERPKVLYNKKTKKFVMWMHVDSHDYAKAAAGVAVCDSPTGIFKYKGSFRPNNQMSRDMTVYQDDDGRAYHVYSSEKNATMQICLLTDDYLKPTTHYTRNFENKFREAPAVFKRNNKYYLITSGCSGWDPNQARLAVADSMLGNWTVIGDPCTGVDAQKTFFAQSTHVLQIAGIKDAYIAMFDRWNKKDLMNSRYVWLPIKFDGDKISIPWNEAWNFGIFKKK